MSFFIALRKEWMELLRSYRFLVVAVVLVFFGLTSPLLAKFTPEIISLLPGGEDLSRLIPAPTVWDAIGQYVKNMGQFGILLALLLSMGAVAQEKDKGTAAMMLVKPLPRSSFLAAKYTALAFMFTITLLAAGIACYYYTLLLFEAMNFAHWMLLDALLLVYVLVYVAITLFASTLTKSQAVAGGVALGLMALLGLAGAIPGLGKYLPGELITWGTRIMHGDSTASWTAFGVSAGIILISLLAGWLIFDRQEL